MPDDTTSASPSGSSNPFGNLLASVPKLDGGNYSDWKFAISMVLRRAGCWDIVEGKTKKPVTRESGGEWERLAQDGLTAIGLTIEPSQYGYIRDCTDGPTAWTALKAIYEKSSRANRIALKRQFYGFEHDTAAPIATYVTGILDLAIKLRAIGVALADDDITDVLIFNLADEWSSIAGALSMAENTTIDGVRGSLIDEEGRRTKGATLNGTGDPDVKVMIARHNTNTHTCWVCGKRGHYARECKFKKSGSQEENPERRPGSRSEKVSLALANLAY